MILKKNLIDKLKMCCFYNDNSRRYDSIGTNLDNNSRSVEPQKLGKNDEEDSSTNYNEISKKNILKIGTPLPLEPSLYSPIHPNRDIEKAK